MSKFFYLLFIICVSHNSIIAKEYKLSLKECLKLALENHLLNKIGELQVELAQAKYKSALATFYPTINLKFGLNWMNNKPQFVIPESQLVLDPNFVDLQASSLALSQLTLQGVSPASVGQDQYNTLFEQTKGQIAEGTSKLTVPEQKLDLLDRRSMGGGADLILPIYVQGKRFIMKEFYDIGRRKSRVFQESMQIEIIYNVNKVYYLYLMVSELEQTVVDLKGALGVSLEVLEKIWENGDDISINKTDVLKHKLVNQQVEVALLEISKKKKQLIGGLAIAMGLPLDDIVIPTDNFLEFPEEPSFNSKTLLDKLLVFNADLNQLEADIELSKGFVALAKSDYQPTVALIGSFAFLESEDNVGAVHEFDKGNLGLGLVVDIPLFSGFSTKKKINEAKIELEVSKHKYLLFKDKALFELKNNLIDLKFCFEEAKLFKNSLKLGEELTDAETKVYQTGDKLDKWEDVLKSQIYVAMLKSQLITKKFEIHMIKNIMSKSVGIKIKGLDETLE